MENSLRLIGRVLFRLSIVGAVLWAGLFFALHLGMTLDLNFEALEWYALLLVGGIGAIAILVIGRALMWALG